MRTIKFRAWDKEIEKMFYPEGETIYEIIKASEECMDECWLLNTDHILMQFTGLHDKNGKEIYEGDILQLNSEKRVYWEIVYDNRNDFPKGWTIKATHPQYSHPEVIRLEIIGNIYENGGLLNDTTTH